MLLQVVGRIQLRSARGPSTRVLPRGLLAEVHSRLLDAALVPWRVLLPSSTPRSGGIHLLLQISPAFSSVASL